MLSPMSWRLVFFHTWARNSTLIYFEMTLTFSLVSNQWFSNFSTLRPTGFLKLFAPHLTPCGLSGWLPGLDSHGLDIWTLGFWGPTLSGSPGHQGGSRSMNDNWWQTLGAMQFSRIFHMQLDIFHWMLCYVTSVKAYLNPKYWRLVSIKHSFKIYKVFVTKVAVLKTWNPFILTGLSICLE